MNGIEILDKDNIHEEVLKSIYNHVADVVESHLLEDDSKLSDKDIVRHKLVQKIINAYEKFEETRQKNEKH